MTSPVEQQATGHHLWLLTGYFAEKLIVTCVMYQEDSPKIRINCTFTKSGTKRLSPDNDATERH